MIIRWVGAWGSSQTDIDIVAFLIASWGYCKCGAVVELNKAGWVSWETEPDS